LSLIESGTDELQDFYECDDPVAVAAFLRLHSELMTTLLEASAEVGLIFGADVRLAIEAIEDDDSGQTLLRVTVKTPKNVATSISSMDRFYADWWVKRSVKERTLIAWTAHPARQRRPVK
jgi:hypothetical protein